MKKVQRLTVAELKQLVKKPEAVEVKKIYSQFRKRFYSPPSSGGMSQLQIQDY